MAAFVQFHTQDNRGIPIAGAALAAKSIFGPWNAVTNGCGDFFTPPPGLAPGHYDVTISAPGFVTRQIPMDLADSGQILIGLEPGSGPVPPGPFPPVPTRDLVLTGQITLQGKEISTQAHGLMPWWGACWAWLSAEDRAIAAQQLLAAGEQICLIQIPDGPPLYDEPLPNFYNGADFPALDITAGNTDMSLVRELVEEALLLGFSAVWVFLGGDDGNGNGYNVAIQQTKLLGPALAESKYGNLNEYVLQVPGWDGVWHKPNPGIGYSREQVQAFAATARAYGAIHLAIEHGTGYELAGKGREDYAPGGVMSGYDLILGEFDDEVFNVDDVWQILARYLGPQYIRPSEQPAIDDPGAPFGANAPQFALAETTPRGRYHYRIFEYFIFGFVRGDSVARVHAAKLRFAAMGGLFIC